VWVLRANFIDVLAVFTLASYSLPAGIFCFVNIHFFQQSGVEIVSNEIYNIGGVPDGHDQDKHMVLK